MIEAEGGEGGGKGAVNIRGKGMEYRPQETAYLESTIGVSDQQQSRSLVPDTR